jgi:NhaP-type Na+/H+ and K+/H+ antiporter
MSSEPGSFRRCRGAVSRTAALCGVQLSKRLSSTLEVESGANDPMAIFMTIGCIQVLTGQTDFGLGLVQLLVTQMGVGALVGLAIGKLGAWSINRMNLDAAGMYPVLASASGCWHSESLLGAMAAVFWRFTWPAS